MFGMLPVRAANPLLVGIIAAYLCAVARPASAATQIDKTIDVNAGAGVELSNVFGTLEIRGWDRAQVRVEGTLGSDSRLQESRDGTRLRLAVQPPQGHLTTRLEPTHLVVYVPQSLPVAAHTVMADLTARDLVGDLDVSSNIGNIDVDVSSAVLHVKTINGKITVSDPSPGSSISLDQVSGTANVTRVNGSLAWNSTSGSIDVDQCAPNQMNLSSVSGQISVRCSIKENSVYLIASRYGRVGIHTISRPDARFALATRYGSIRNAFKPSQPLYGQPVDRVSRFTVGDGHALVTVETESGGIVLD